MDINPRFKYPPPIARTLGFDLVESGERTATIDIVTDLAKHANPMGTVHGGVLCDGGYRDWNVPRHCLRRRRKVYEPGPAKQFRPSCLERSASGNRQAGAPGKDSQPVRLRHSQRRRKTRGAGVQHSDDVKRRESIRTIGGRLMGKLDRK